MGVYIVVGLGDRALQILSVIFRKVCVCVEGRKEGNEPPTALNPPAAASHITNETMMLD